jgi:hypothetical protein
MANTLFFKCFGNRRKWLEINGVPGGIRTHNLLIRSQKLYPVELQAHDAFLYDRSGSDSTQESANLPSFDELKGQRNTSPAGTTWRGLDSAVEEHARIIFFVSQIRDASDQSHIPSDVVFT